MRAKLDHMAALETHGIQRIDLVCVNLYEFEKIAANKDATLEDLIENIDIGGPTMIRAAAKNWQDVAVVDLRPADYAGIIEELGSNRARCRKTPIGDWPRKHSRPPRPLRSRSSRCASLRNSALGRRASRHARHPRGAKIRAALWRESASIGRALRIRQARASPEPSSFHGKELSYNNLGRPGCRVAIDCRIRRSRCGHHQAHQPVQWLRENLPRSLKPTRRAFEADPVSAYGGVLAFNRAVDEETAAEIAKTFVEAIAAPEFSDAALQILGAKRNLRMLKVSASAPETVVKSISGGFLAQTPDTHRLSRAEMQVKSKRAPSEEEWAALEFGWKVSKLREVERHRLRLRAGQTVSVGAGQMSRTLIR